MTKAVDEALRRRRAMARSNGHRRLCVECGEQFVGRNRATCSEECAEKKRSRRTFVLPGEPLTNDFLPADAEENRSRTPVPSPEEIAAACYALRSEVGMIWDGSDLS